MDRRGITRNIKKLLTDMHKNNQILNDILKMLATKEHMEGFKDLHNKPMLSKAKDKTARAPTALEAQKPWPGPGLEPPSFKTSDVQDEPLDVFPPSKF